MFGLHMSIKINRITHNSIVKLANIFSSVCLIHAELLLLRDLEQKVKLYKGASDEANEAGDSTRIFYIMDICEYLMMRM